MDYDYQLKGGKLKVKVTAVEDWHVRGLRNDNGKEDIFPIQYFKVHFKEIPKESVWCSYWSKF